MESNTKTSIKIETIVNAPVEMVWQKWTNPDDITHWNFASDEWHSPKATNDLKEGGRFNYRMEAKDGSMGFDFEGTYNKIEPHKSILYTMDDGRKVDVTFENLGNATRVTEVFEAEGTHSIEMQRDGWQAILNNFKRHTENSH